MATAESYWEKHLAKKMPGTARTYRTKFDAFLEFTGLTHERVYEMQREAVQAFLQMDVQLAIVVFGKMKFMREKEEALLKKILEKTKDVDKAVALSMIARDLRRIAGYAVAVGDDAMNRVLTPA